MRITRPLIGTAIGAGALGATLALSLTVASAATNSVGAIPSHSSSTRPASPVVPNGGQAHRPGPATHACPDGGHHSRAGAGSMRGGTH